ncbi:MAG: C40 family peptidase [Bacteroidales bacterium]|nr:C40 family peptidase [Bacteroidales bacterium]MBQ5539356.1 C40 family peptidase [Bacteroidales bacterium]
MKRKILLLAFLGLFGSVNANNYDPELPFVVTNTADVLKGDYDKYGEKLGTKFKGTEDLKLLKEIVSWLGTPYKYAASNKGKGTDCSGFVSGVYNNVYNIKLQRSSSSMVVNVNKVNRNELECGDLLFFANDKGSIYHVAIYLANDVFAHSATSKNIGVKTDNLNSTYYKKAFYSAGRVKQLDKRGTVSEDEKSTSNSVVSGIDKDKNNKTNESVEDLYAQYSRDFGVKFSGKEDLTILKEIHSWLGTPYQSGQSQKGVGADAAGFVSGVFENACKVLLSRTPDKMKKNLSKTSKNQLKFGDVVFYKKGESYPIIGIYLADGKIVYTSVSKGVITVDMKAVTFSVNFMGSVPALNY